MSVFGVVGSSRVMIRACSEFTLNISLARICWCIASIDFRKSIDRIRYLTKRSSPYITKSLVL